MADPADLFVVLSHLRRLKPISNLSDNFFSYELDRRLGKANWEFISKSPLVKDWDEFDVGYLGKMCDDFNSVLDAVIQKADDNSTKKRNELLAKLKAVEPQTFGTGLMTALLAENSPVERTFIYLAGHLEQIKQAPDLKRQALMETIQQVINKKHFRDNYEPEDDQAKVFYAYFNTLKKPIDLSKATELFLAMKIRNMDFDSYLRDASELIGKLLDEDEAQAEKVYQHAAKTASKAMKRFGRGFMPESPEARLLENITESSSFRQGNWETVKFVLAKIQDAKTSVNINQYRHSSLMDEPSRSTLRKRFAKSRKKLTDAGVTKAQATVQAYVEVIKNLGEAFDPVRIPNVSRLIDFAPLNGEQRKQVIQALSDQAKDSVLVKETLLLLQAKTLGKDQPLPEELIAYYRDLVSDENLSSMWRLGVCSELLSNFRQHKELDTLELLAIKLISKSTIAAFSDHSLPRQIAKSLNRKELQGEWKTAAEEFCKAWRKIALKPIRGRGRIQYSSGYPWDTDVSLSMLEVHLKLGDSDNAKRILANRKLNLAENMETYAVLLKYPYTEWLSEKFSKRWRKIELQTRSHYSLTPEMQAAASKVIAGIADSDVQYLAKIMYASFPLKKDKDGTVNSPRMRLCELAKSFSKRNIADKILRRRCLILLVGADVLGPIKSDIYEFGASLSAESLAMEENRDNEKQKLYQAYVKYLIQDGKLDPFIKDVKEVAKATEYSNSWQAKQMLERMLESLSDYLIGSDNKDPAKWANTPADYLTVLEAFRAADDSVLGESPDIRSVTVVLYLICGKDKELESFLADLDPDSRSILLNICMKLFARAAESYQGQAQQPVAKGLIAFITSADIRKHTPKTSRPFTRVKAHSAIKDSDVLCKAIENEAQTVLAKLEAQQAQKGDSADLLMRLADCYGATGDLSKGKATVRKWVRIDPGRASYLSLAELLKEQGKYDETITLCEELIRKYPQRVSYYNTLMLACLDANNNDRAVEIAQLCVDKFPRNGKALMDMGKVLYKIGKYEESLEAYSQAEHSTNNHAYSHRIPIKIGMVNFALKRYDLAEEAARNGGGCDDQAIKEAAKLLKMVQKGRAEGKDQQGNKEPSGSPLSNSGKS